MADVLNFFGYRSRKSSDTYQTPSSNAHRSHPINDSVRKSFLDPEIDLELPVAILAKSPKFYLDLINWIAEDQGSVTLLAWNALTKINSQQFSYLFVDLDDYSISDDLIATGLLNFRRRVPSQPLILVSSAFIRDDLTAERLPIGDTSLKYPMTLSRAEIAMVMAVTNNEKWVRDQEIANPTV